MCKFKHYDAVAFTLLFGLPSAAYATGVGFGLSKTEGYVIFFVIYVVIPVSIGFGAYKLLCRFFYSNSDVEPRTLKRVGLVILCLYLAWVGAGVVNL